MKIKIFQSYDRENLAETVNNFIQTMKVVNMQLSVLLAPNDQYTRYVLLLQYEE